MTDETNGAKEEEAKDAQDERPNRRRQILIWAAALLGGLTFALLGKYAGWTGFYAFALTCAVIPKITTEETLRRHKVQLRRWKWGLIAVGAGALGLLLGPDSFEWAVGWLRRHETLTDPLDILLARCARMLPCRGWDIHRNLDPRQDLQTWLDKR